MRFEVLSVTLNQACCNIVSIWWTLSWFF